MSESGAEEPTLPAGDVTARAGDTGVHNRSQPLRRGTAVGRYVVLGPLGSGGMGVVYAAFDPELDRRVALKFLHPSGVGSVGDDELMRRLLREAKTMARLTHPNVVPVHDVGRHEEGIFIAMGFVDGVTLREWLRAEERTRADVIETFIAAARGLEAAHGAGIVHRDFKPDNVMVGHDGSVQVLDFGLARTRTVNSLDGGTESSGGGLMQATTSMSAPLPTVETQGLAGTPAYMSPEHLKNKGIDERSDQFSLCVALFEALYRVRPFEGSNLADLTATVCAGQIRPPPSGSDVPRWLHDRIVRGLRPAPEERWPTMAAFIESLTHDPVARRRKRMLTVGGVAIVAGSGVAAGVLIDRAPECADGASDVDEAWGDERREAVAAAVARSDALFAQSTWDRVRPALDDYATAWAEGFRDACNATRRTGQQSEHVFDLRMACLQRARVELDAFAGLLLDADEEVLARAAQGVGRLPPLQHCADQEALLAAVPPPSDASTRSEVEEIHADLGRARVDLRMGRFDASLQQLRALLRRAEATGYEPVVGEVLTLLGEAQLQHGELEASETTLHDALWTSFAAGDRIHAATAAGHLTYLAGVRLGRPREGLQWGERANEIYTQISPGSTGHATALTNLGSALRLAGDYDAAIASLERAVAMREARADVDPMNLASTLSNLGVIYDDIGRYRESRKLYERVIELYESAVGPDHPTVGRSRGNLAVPLFRLGEHDAARREMEAAVAIAEAAFGPTHPQVIDAVTNFGAMLLEFGNPQDAQPWLERALAIATKAYGDEHPKVALVHYNLGNLAKALGEQGAALQEHRHALEIRRKVLGDDHPWVADSINAVGAAHRLLGHGDEALAAFAEALALATESLPDEHSTVTIIRENYGDQLATEGRHAEAIAQLEHAVPGVQAREGESSVTAAFLRAKIGESELARERFSEAAAAYSKSLEVLENDPGGKPYVPYVLSRRAEAYLRGGEPKRAREDIEIAASSWPDAALSPQDHARIDFIHARALWATDDAQRDRARELAREAAQTLPEDDALRREIESWLDGPARSQRARTQE